MAMMIMMIIIEDDAHQCTCHPPRLLPCIHQPTQASAATIPEESPAYWHAVQRCVALGWLVPAAALLGLHTAWQRVQLSTTAGDSALAGQLQVLEAVLILLRRMPVLAAPGGAGEGLRRMVAAAGEDAAAEFVQKRYCVVPTAT